MSGVVGVVLTVLGLLDVGPATKAFEIAGVVWLI
jgi:hypothetical protein